MIQIVPVNKPQEDKLEIKNNILEIGNIENDSMTMKLNRAIEFALKNTNDDIICIRHDDATIRAPLDITEYRLRDLFKDEKVGIAGVIGTCILEDSCTWWNPNRQLNAVGAIIQGGKNEKGEPIEYWMKDLPGKYDYLASVDGCCVFFPRRVFEHGLRYDENLKGFHFYDVDICCQLLEKGMKVATIDIAVFHKSEGPMEGNFEELRKIFRDKWTKKIEHWPISRLTKFKKGE